MVQLAEADCVRQGRLTDDEGGRHDQERHGLSGTAEGVPIGKIGGQDVRPPIDAVQGVSGLRASRWRRHLGEVFVCINGVQHYLWRAVDHEGEVLEGRCQRKLS